MRESDQLAAAAIRDGLGADCSAATLPYIALANIAANRGDIGTAHRLVEDALRAFDDSGLHDDWHHVLMVTCDAMWSVMAGELDRARERMAVVMPTVRRLGNPSALTFALYALGSASWRDEPDLALASLVESVVLTQSGASEAALGPCLSQIARIRARRGEGGLALRRLREALAHCHEVADRVEFAGVLLNGAEVLSLLEHHDVVATVHGFLSEGPLVDFTPRFGGPESDEQQRAFAQAQEVLGAERHAPAYARGAAMSYEAIAEYVLTTLDRLIAA
jgi:hypothetical protein